MKKIVVIGNSLIGVKVLELIRAADQQSDLAIFTLDGLYPYDRSLFPDFCLKKIKEDKLFFRLVDFYKSQRINVILDRQISRVNLKKKKIYTDQKDQIDFDILLIADTNQVKYVDVKGTAKSGLFNPSKLTDFKKMMSSLSLFETIVIETHSFFGMGIVEALKKRGKEVLVICPHPNVIQGAAENDVIALKKSLEENGIRLILDNSIVELLGDNDIKAVRLKSGKVIACEMVLFANPPMDLRIFADSGLEIQQRILVDSDFRSVVEGVYAIDQASQMKDVQFDSSLINESQQVDAIAASISSIQKNQTHQEEMNQSIYVEKC